MEAIPEVVFWFKLKAGLCYKSAGMLKNAEELKRGPNREVGPKGFLRQLPNILGVEHD